MKIRFDYHSAKYYPTVYQPLVLDLFSGIGGFSLGLERAGFETVAFCEIDKCCQEVLRSNWPNVFIFNDVKEIQYSDPAANEGEDAVNWYFEGNIDLICGGYPCVGHSVAGNKKGFKNEESALWKEYFRIVKSIKPKYCIIENSPNLRNTGLAELLQAFNEIGYDAEWSIISAYSVGAPHQRERIYIVFWRRELSYPDPFRWFRADPEKKKAASRWWAERQFKRSTLFKQAAKVESRVLQFDDGVSEEMVEEVEEKIKQLGNSLLPQIPELIGRALISELKELWGHNGVWCVKKIHNG